MEASKMDLSNRLYALIAVVVAGLMIYFGFRAVEIWKNFSGYYPREISVEATGTAYVVPDVAEVVLGLGVVADTADEAVLQNTETMNKVRDVLKQLEIAPNDIKTTYYSLYENYVWEDEKNTQEGFRLEHNLKVKVRDFEKIGEVISQSTAAGANIVSGVTFVVDDMESAKSLAREEAIAKAKEKAKEISAQSGLSLGKILNFYEYSNDYMPYGKGGAMAVSYDSAVLEESRPAPSIEPGEEEINLTVSLTYRVY